MFVVANNFNEIYHTLLLRCLRTPVWYTRDSHEVFNCSFILKNPSERLVKSEARAFKHDFAKKFFQWIWDGHDDVTLLFDENEKAKDFHEGDTIRNTAYGPRIANQLPAVIEELMITPESRRGVIMILDSEDQILLPKKREGTEKTEYPCTGYLMFVIRDHRLHMYVSMRSNNITTTICYDVYNFTRMQVKVCDILKETYPTLKLGEYHHAIASAHILTKELELAEKILDEYKQNGK